MTAALVIWLYRFCIDGIDTKKATFTDWLGLLFCEVAIADSRQKFETRQDKKSGHRQDKVS